MPFAGGTHRSKKPFVKRQKAFLQEMGCGNDESAFLPGKTVDTRAEEDRQVVDENGTTTVPGVFAAGDVVTGAKTVVHAVEGAKIAAKALICWLES